MTILENNLKTFLDWSFLGIGSWFDATIPTSGAYGGNFHTLRLVDDPSYSAGQVWETPRKDLVWETGVSYDTQPIQISGVWVGGSFYGTGDATYGHYVDYPNGRVVFDSAISTSSSVTMNYSHRWVQTYVSDRAPWWREIQNGSFRVDNTHVSQTTSGEWGILSHNRVQLPAIVIETVPRRVSRGYELGNSANWVHQDVLFHIFTENKWDKNQLIDIIALQNDKSIYLYNDNRLVEDEKYPLDYRGMLVNDPIMYPTLVNTSDNGGYRWKKCTFQNARISDNETLSPTLHRGTVRTTFEVVLGGTIE